MHDAAGVVERRGDRLPGSPEYRMGGLPCGSARRRACSGPALQQIPSRHAVALASRPFLRNSIDAVVKSRAFRSIGKFRYAITLRSN
jgi:hypothetical protein